ncbi:hypothetical protein AMAG_17559 [Allomyces macrogynus ATCC 38327]|uniref:Globin-sensor domain-containing protein n=1 Tax=Allomyces macrogynus (strain ATCC 38327) TaxID=578462 RepID=A0A0L0TF59_ALLM3|nr:hypothetical protein AMAG_17559 [Allomyces macrogynus ATCC 38327]|eukprot:KNE73335.1 hypothetical protein AMAG_17559 [Allomyces macrogynus ATCC 38327]
MSAPSSPALPPADAPGESAAPTLVDLTEAVPASDDAASATTTSTTVTTTVHETDDGHVIEEVVEEVVEEELIDAPVVDEAEVPAPNADADEPVTVGPEKVVDRAAEPAVADDEAVPEPIAESVTDSGLLVDPPTPAEPIEEETAAPAAAIDAVADAAPPVIDPVAAANAAAASSASAPKCPFAGADAIKDPLADVHQILADNADKIAAAAAALGVRTEAAEADPAAADDEDNEIEANADHDEELRGRSPAPDSGSDLHIEEEDTANRPARLPSPLRAALKADLERKRQSLTSSNADNHVAEAAEGAAGEPAARSVRFADDPVASTSSTEPAKPAAPVTPALKYIDRTKLYTDVTYRVQYVSDFLDFGPDDRALISMAAPLLAPHIPAIVDNVYKTLLSYDITAQSFLHTMENYHGQVIRKLDSLNVESELIRFRKNIFKRYLVCTMLGTEQDQTMIQYMDWVALIHTTNTSKHSSINIEYIHINALMAHLTGALIETLATLGLPQDTLRRTQAAFNKLMWVQSDLFALYYTYDGNEIPEHVAHVHGVKRPIPASVAESMAKERAVVRERTLLATVGAGVLATAAGFGIGWFLGRR